MCRNAVVGLLVLAAAACDLPTAPQALDIAVETQRLLLAGDLDGAARLRRMLGPGPFVWTDFKNVQNPADDHRLTVALDTVMQGLSAFVVEVFWVPPTPYGKPFVTRAVHGWPSDTMFGVFAVAEGSIDSIVDMRAERWGARDVEAPFAMIMVHYPRPHMPWIIDGEAFVRIANAEVGKPCEWKPEPVTTAFKPTDVKCELAVYNVELRGAFVSAADTSRPLEFSRTPQGPLAFRRPALSNVPRHTLAAHADRVPGMRFTARCPDVIVPIRNSVDAACTMYRNQFWQDNRLFAKELGVDVGSMKYKSTSHVGADLAVLYQDVVQEGSAPGRSAPGSGEPWMMRWTIYRPDGRVVETGSIGSNVPEPWPRSRQQMAHLSENVPWGVRRKALIAEARLDPSASAYSMLVLDIELGPPR